MERLTEKLTDGRNVLKENYAYVTNPKHGSFIEGKAIDKLAEYEQAEEDGLLKMLPVTIGSDVYYIPSKVNYKLNVLSKHEEHNRVYHQKVERISFNQRGWYLECDKDLEYGTGHILVDIFYKKTWFTTEAEAEQALAKMKGE